MVAALGEAFAESATDFSGRSSHENFHVTNVTSRASGELEKTAMPAANPTRRAARDRCRRRVA
jgi:hypothetical protein